MLSICTTPVGATALGVLKAHGCFPVASSGLGGDVFYIDMTGERCPFRGADWDYAADAGVFAVYLAGARTLVSGSVGGRPAFVS